MGRFVIGLIVGALGAAAIFAIDLDGLTLSPPLVAIAGGLLIGALLGWRNPHPNKALVSGVLTGGLAGLLMGIGQFVGVAQAAHLPHIPIWMRDISQYSPMYGWLTRGMGGLMLLLLAGIGGSFAGLLSGWTGFGPRTHAAGAPARSTEPANLLPGPAE